MLRGILTIALLWGATSVRGAEIGDHAKYTMNRDLTSGVIRSGAVDITVADVDDRNQTYLLDVACDFRLFAGRHRGRDTTSVAADLVDGRLVKRLRVEG